jgi:uncharacterized protein (TIGR02271 family)
MLVGTLSCASAVRTNSAIRELDDPADGSRDVHLLGEAANPAATRSRRAGGRRPTPEALRARADSSGDVFVPRTRGTDPIFRRFLDQRRRKREGEEMRDELTMQELGEMRGLPVYASDGDKIGQVDEIFYDEETNRPEWIGIGTGFLGTKRVLVPVEGADYSQDGLTVRYSKEQVKDSPDIDSDELSQETEQELYSYYGLGYSERRSGTGLPEGGRERVDEAETSVTRSEEELAVGTRDVEAGRARLRKWVETEPVEMDVELKRETARVTREPIDRAVSDAEIGEEEVAVELREEEAVVQKQAVAKERVGLERDVETTTETVSDEVRKERVEVEGGEEAPRRKR